MSHSGVIRDSSSLFAFITGCVAVTIGVLLHLPMFWMGKDMGFRMAGMAMDNGMIAGMFLIVGGVGVAAYGLLPKMSQSRSRHRGISAWQRRRMRLCRLRIGD